MEKNYLEEEKDLNKSNLTENKNLDENNVDEDEIILEGRKIKIKNYTLSEFEFENGEVLNDLNVEYMCYGEKKFNSKGELTNGFLYIHGSSGNCRSFRHMGTIVGKDKPLDPNKYFIIAISSLGSPGSASPSTSNLSYKFPQYSIQDMVNFQKSFLKEKFNIKHLKGIMGNSLGGCQAISWACNYPETIDFLIPLVSSYTLAGHNIALSHLMNEVIKTDKEYMQGRYEKQPLNAIKISNLLMYNYGLSLEYYRSLSKGEIISSMDEMAEESIELDANDIVWRNNATLDFNMENHLSKISADTLIIAITQDQYFPPNLDAIPMSKMIKNSKLITYDSLLGHVGSHEIEKIENDLFTFISKHY